VSEGVLRTHTWRTKDGHLVSGNSTLQFFYDEAGYVSFVVGVVQDYAPVPEEEWSVSYWDALCNAVEVSALVRNEATLEVV